MEFNTLHNGFGFFSHISSTIQHRRLSSSSTIMNTQRKTPVSTPPRRLSAEPSTFDLKDRAITTLETLYNSPSTSTTDFISPDVVIERDDDGPTSHFVFCDSWSQTLAGMPDFRFEVAEAVADNIQRKVWVRSEVTGLPDGRRRESIDMMEFSEDGVLVSTSGFWRTVKDKARG